MTDYEDIEREQAQGILGLRGLRPSSSLQINGAREAVNRVRYTDAELLVVAGNRIRAMEASHPSDGSWWHALTKLLRDAPDARETYLEVDGQELQALMRLAGVRERDPVVGHHPYRVRYEYFRRLFRAASRSTEDKGESRGSCAVVKTGNRFVHRPRKHPSQHADALSPAGHANHGDRRS